MAISSSAVTKRVSETSCMTITSRASSPMPALDDAPHRDLVVAEHLGDLREHARAGRRPRGGGRRPSSTSRAISSVALRLVHRRASADHRDDVAEHRGGGLGPAGARARTS